MGSVRNATLLKSDVANAITDLKQQRGKNVAVHGSLTLVEGLLQADLLDEMRLEIYPVLAGETTRERARFSSRLAARAATPGPGSGRLDNPRVSVGGSHRAIAALRPFRRGAAEG